MLTNEKINNYFWLYQQVVGSMDVPSKMVVHIPGTPGGMEDPSDSDDTSD